MAGNIQHHAPETGQPPAGRGGHPLMTLRDEVDRLFESFFPATRSMFEVDPFRRIGTAFRTMGDMAPQVDVKETDDRFEIVAELPGLDENGVDVTLREGILVISGEKKAEHKEEKADYHLTERSFGAFTRSFRLPDTADEDGIDAKFDKGILTITVPKKPDAKKQEKKISIKGH